MSTDCCHGKVLRLFHKWSPPLGGTYTSTSNFGIGKEVEVTTCCIITRILLKFLSCNHVKFTIVVEESCHTAVEPVVRSGKIHIAHGEILAAVHECRLFNHVKEQVPAHFKTTRFCPYTKNTGIIGAINKTEIVDRIVIEGQLCDCSRRIPFGLRIVPYESPVSVGNSIVDKRKLIEGRFIAKVKTVATASAILVVPVN